MPYSMSWVASTVNGLKILQLTVQTVPAKAGRSLPVNSLPLFRNLKRYTKAPYQTTVVRRLTMGIRSEKGIVRQFLHCVNATECAYTNLDNIAYYTPSLYGIAYCSYATNLHSMLLYQILYTIVSIIILYYITILWDHRHIYRPSLTETSLCGTWLYSKPVQSQLQNCYLTKSLTCRRKKQDPPDCWYLSDTQHAVIM